MNNHPPPPEPPPKRILYEDVKMGNAAKLVLSIYSLTILGACFSLITKAY